MLQSMRQNTKTVLWIVVIAFVVLIFATWGADLRSSGSQKEGNVIGEVNGRSVTGQEYEKAYQDELTSYRGEEDVPILPAVARQLRERAWGRLVGSAIVESAMERHPTPISDEEVVYAIRTNPPDFLRTNESFLTNGQFDYQKYRQAIDDPNVDWRWLEEYFRGQLPLGHLRQRVAISARVTEGELRDLYVQNNETVDFSFVAFLPTEFEKTEVSAGPADMQAYYDAHREEFRVPERATIDYVALPILPSEEDREYLRSRMQEVLKRLGEGTPFEDLARYYSEGPTAQQGGDIGAFKRGDLTPDVEATAFSLAPGQVSPVLEGPAAFQIVQVVERTGNGKDESVRLRQIFMKVESGGDTAEKVRLAAEELRKNAESAGLGSAAEGAGVALHSTPPFEQGPFVPGIGPFRAANLFAFASEVGRVSEPVFNNDAYYVMAVASRDSAQVEPFETAMGRVRAAVAKEKRLQMARAEADRFRGEAASGIEALARKAGREVRQASLISRAGSVPTVGRDSRLILSAFGAAERATAGPVHTDYGSFYIRTEKMNPVDEERYLSEKAYYIRSLLAQRQEYLFNLWIQKESQKAAVKDMRPPMTEIQEAG